MATYPTSPALAAGTNTTAVNVTNWNTLIDNINAIGADLVDCQGDGAAFPGTDHTASQSTDLDDAIQAIHHMLGHLQTGGNWYDDPATNGYNFAAKGEFLDASNPQLRLTQADGTVFTDFQTDGSGAFNVRPAGGYVYIEKVDEKAAIVLYRNDDTEQDNDVVGRVQFNGKNDAGTPEIISYGYIDVLATDVSDGTENGEFQWTLVENTNLNLAMTLSSAGLLSLDAAGDGTGLPTLFDDYNDVLEIDQLIRRQDLKKKEAMGLITFKENGRYMWNLQPIINLIGGGLAQLYHRMAELEDEMAMLKAV